MVQLPVAIGLHVCEQVIYEEETKNVTLVNCFRKRILEQVPSEPFPFTVFAWLTDGQGNMTIDLLIEREDDLEEVHRESGPLHLTSPLQEVRCRFRIRTCRFPTVGAYRVALLVDGELIAQRGFKIALAGG